ncbi:hypothetical protein E2C01_030459 [Portunus trituberculatus]|uniref:Uncharacterized protein n=1 Tax=Portunus trituberculatus TaxID=210409 RepID=A0A5B7EUW7_PORTR|nr:hypothetical protein [Portunus trituberculatus]
MGVATREQIVKGGKTRISHLDLICTRDQGGTNRAGLCWAGLGWAKLDWADGVEALAGLWLWRQSSTLEP